jgi:hypothetical protein
VSPEQQEKEPKEKRKNSPPKKQQQNNKKKLCKIASEDQCFFFVFREILSFSSTKGTSSFGVKNVTSGEEEVGTVILLWKWMMGKVHFPTC